jgi:hypothetical protein
VESLVIEALKVMTAGGLSGVSNEPGEGVVSHVLATLPAAAVTG